MAAYPAHLEKRAEAIQAARKASAGLLAASEKLRVQTDALSDALHDAAISNAIDQADYERLHDHVDRIRRMRNGMEAFAAECRIREVMDKAWQQLP